MKAGKPVRMLSLGLLTMSFLAACGSSDPQTLVTSAKDYLAKKDDKAAVIQLKNALVKNPEMPEARYLLGKTLLETGDASGAEIELRKADALHYDPNKLTPTLAKALLETGQPQKVTALSTKDLTDAAALAELETSVGIAYAMQGDLTKARQFVDEALKTKPDYGPAMVAKARLDLAGKDVDGSMAMLDGALKTNPGDYEALTLKGNILNSQGQTDQAIAMYQKALQSKPDYVPASSALVTLYFRENKLDAAGKQIEAMKKAAPNNLQTAMLEAVYDFQKQDYTKARDIVEKIQRGIPNDPRILTLAGAIQMKLNSFLQAEDSFKRASSLSPGAVAPRRLLAELYLRNNMPAKALDEIEPLLKNADNDPGLLMIAGTAYLQTGNALLANDYFTRAAKLQPANKSIQVESALSQLALGQKDSGYATLEQVAGSDKGTNADMVLIATAIRQKEYDRAMQAIDNLEKKMPNSPIPNALRGTAMMDKGDFSSARVYLQKALAIKPDYFPVVANLAAMDIREKKYDDAKARYEALLKIQPGNLQALLSLASLEQQTGGTSAQVEDLLTKAVKGNPKEPVARLALIKFYMNAKNPKKAVAVAQDAVTAIPDRPDLLDALSRAQFANGQSTDALATYGRVIKAAPNSAASYLGLADLQMATKQKDAAIQSLNKSLDIKNDFLPAQEGLISIYLKDKNYSSAMDIVRSIQKQLPAQAVGSVLEGDVHGAQQQWGAAATSYHMALAKQADSELAIKYHFALVKAGKAKEADAFVNTWLSAHGSDDKFRLYMAQNALNSSNLGGAVSQYQAILKLEPNNIIVLNNLAWAMGQMNNPQALGYAEQAYKLAPKQPQIMDTLAMLVAKQGDTTRAIGILRDALAITPDAHDIQLDLAKVYLQAHKQDDARTILNELDKLGNSFASNQEVKKLLATGFKP
jgi:putative PEP-CTERM system TPR-repeat lipoprotein